MTGKVILVGAGPGDAGLLTLQGKHWIESADVVVYDRLVGQGVMAMVPEHVRTIDVGKISSYHKIPQEQINQILLDEALAGNVVVRLKGGDPFVFGRGGEELELLQENGVPFEVVPGITSAIAASAYAGIPITHRDCCSSLHIVTAHPKKGAPLDIDFDALIRTKGTLVFLMGVSAVETITQGLLAAGMTPDMPAAMVENGTLPVQRRIDGTLATLAQKAKVAEVKSPAIILVGKVCALGEQFAWMENRPLHGKSILVTRPKERAGALSDKLRQLGAAVEEYPCIETQPITPCLAMEQALLKLEQYQWLCFTSPAGVDCFWSAMEQLDLDARALHGVKLAVIGQGTAKALKAHGLNADYLPEIYDANHLGQGLAELATGRILILRAEIGSPELTENLNKQGLDYDDIAVYHTVYDHPQSQSLRGRLDAGALPYVTFTSASTVKGFVNSVGADADFSTVTGLCIGHQTAQEAQRYGIATQIASKATLEALTELICQTL